MSNVTDESSQSTTEQVKEKVQDVPQQAKGQTRDQLRDQIDTRSTQAGEQLRSAAQAVRRASAQLREEGQETPAKVVDQLADRAERLGGYLTEADGSRILRDVERFARRQPWLFVGGSAIVGFFASRFMKASSSRRFEESDPSPVYGRASRSTSALSSAATQDAGGYYVAEGEPAVSTRSGSGGIVD
jgi:ElaB/YqjD/DUF883 family membrane-anchored ribosome-binding protein